MSGTRASRLRRGAALAAIGLLLLAPSWPVHAEPVAAGGDPSLSLYWENDTKTHSLLARQSDRAYTNGARIVLQWPAAEVGAQRGVLSTFTRWAERVPGLPWFATGDVEAVGLAIGQNMYTPGDLAVATLLERDRPYGGWTYLGAISSVAVRDLALEGDPDRKLFALPSLRRLSQVEVDLGVVGPASGAAETQTWVHTELCADCVRPVGWNHQLRNELVLQLHHDVAWKWLELYVTEPSQRPGFRKATSRYFDVVPSAGSSLGNAFVLLRGQLTARLGWNLSGDMGPSAKIRSVDTLATMASWRWEVYAFGRFEPRLVGRNLFLNGNTFQDSHRVPHNGAVYDWEWGAQVRVARLRLMWRRIQRSPEFSLQHSPHIYGAWTLAIDPPRRWLQPPRSRSRHAPRPG